MFGYLANDEYEAFQLFKGFNGGGNISSSDHRDGLNELVKDYKVYGLWPKMTAIYPFAGNNSVSQALNLVSTSSFLIQWTGSTTHSLGSYRGNLTNTSANTRINVSSSLISNNVHLGIWSIVSGGLNGGDIGISDTGADANTLLIEMKWSDNFTYSEAYNFNEAGGFTSASLGAAFTYNFGLLSRTHRAKLEYYANGTIKATNSISNSLGTTTAGTILIGAERYGPFVISNRPYMLAVIGSGLTQAEASASYYIAQRWISKTKRFT